MFKPHTQTPCSHPLLILVIALISSGSEVSRLPLETQTELGEEERTDAGLDRRTEKCSVPPVSDPSGFCGMRDILGQDTNVEGGWSRKKTPQAKNLHINCNKRNGKNVERLRSNIF